ncbi:amidohydrolase [Smaragdicoccus niigatensis]|uniref:amidohydrolase n=1 Tax=Smaragdicoccus niigatensis TaxID=359359 RepID=UPI00039BE17F|nr:amidohydrolase family protein [Smaragdicoccus niigatensis]
MATQLLIDGRIYSPSSPGATAMAVTDGVIVWLGSDRPGLALHPDAEVIRLEGAFVAPAFVDAHVHTTSFGLTRTGIDLSVARNREECLSLLRNAASDVVWAQGWDDSAWPDSGPLTQAEVDGAVGDRVAYVPRIDGHSAIASRALRSTVDGDLPEGMLTADDHHRVRVIAQTLLSVEQRTEARTAALDLAASRGVVSVHECGGPKIGGLIDFRETLTFDHGVNVYGLWGQAVETAEEARMVLAETGAAGLAGDLFVDGSIGSGTAALSEPYSDCPHSTGTRYLSDDAVRQHIRACTEACVQAGFHAIGDAAIGAVTRGFEAAIEEFGSAAVAACHHRVEHAVMIAEEHIRVLALAGVIASVQPGFEHAFGGANGSYARRIGADRARAVMPFAPMVAAGIPIAIGSDAPVTPLDPWAAVKAAVNHRTPGFAISPRAAFGGATRGGWRAAGVRDGVSGTLVPGAPASFAVWEPTELIVSTPKDAVQRWSTDPRSLVPPLPPLGADSVAPRCLRTVRAGRTIYAA